MKNTTLNNTSQSVKIGRPRSTAFTATKQTVRNNRVDTKSGRIFNRDGTEIGSSTYEPRVTVHLENGKKYGLRINKVIGFVQYGVEALRRGVSVIHKNGNKYDNRATNLELRYNRAALRAYNRLQASA